MILTTLYLAGVKNSDNSSWTCTSVGCSIGDAWEDVPVGRDPCLDAAIREGCGT
jgi:hypothetical protein